ncbi:Inner centromere protein, ARK-binding region protein [Ceratobasidium theobromae]|uniref:Inner centromere protein, ARK-binding region protein n=1 Tax=Ceratobasidium theobromae TaxID=1582974 RepID=A0A5N5QGV5_9AGAM|nr:Inner centromere protein, ARK-binding region protein [Ceratobasidium theobromae]
MSLGFAQWATGVRNRMAADPGRADIKDQVQCHGYLFLHEYLDDVLNAPRLDNVIEFTKTPGRNRTAKKTRTVSASAQKIKPVAPISFATSPKDKENDSSTCAPKQPQLKPARFQPNPPADSTSRDSIARATPARSGVPIFSPTNALAGQPALPTPSDDPLSPFRDASSNNEKSATTAVIAQQIFAINPAIETPAPVEEPSKAPASETQPTEVDLSIIHEDDEGHSISTFEDAREDFTGPQATVAPAEVESDIAEVAQESIPASVPIQQRLPSPPASEDTPASTSIPATPIQDPPHEPTEPLTSSNVTLAHVFESAAPVPEPAPVPAPIPAVVSKPLSAAASQPTPPPEPTKSMSRPLPIPPTTSRANSGSGLGPTRPPIPPQSVPVAVYQQLVPVPAPQSQPTAAPAPTSRASSAVPRGPFAGPSLKELRREPSVSGAGTHRELRQSSWRKKPEGTNATTSAIPSAATATASTDSEPPRLKRKSDALPRQAPSKSQKLSRDSSPGSSSDEETEMQVPIKDEDGGSGWNATSGSMLDDLRNRLARLEKSTNGKTPAASRVWTSTASSNLPSASAGAEKRLSLSDLSVRPNPALGNEKEKAPEKIVGLELGLGLSTDNPASSMLSNRTTTPENSPPPVRRVLPAPPVFTLPEPEPEPEPTPVPAPAKSSSSSSNADAVRANAKAEAARLFGGTKLFAPPSRTDTQSTVGSGTDADSIFDMRSQSQTQTQTQTQSTRSQSQSVFAKSQSQETDIDDIDLDLDEDLDVDVDGDGDADVDADVDVDGMGEDEEDGKTASSQASSSTQTRSMAKKGPVKSIQLAAAAKKAADGQDRKATRIREMEERRQAAAQRKAEEDKTRSLEQEKKRKEREELAASKNIKPPVKKVTEDPNKKRKVETEKKVVDGKKPVGPSTFAQSSTVAAPTASSSTKSRIGKPTATTAATPGPSGLKSALKQTQNPFAGIPPPSATKTLKPSASSSSLKSAAAKKPKGNNLEAPGQALQAQMQARLQAQLKAARKDPEVRSENIELPDINSEYSDSEDEDRGKDFPGWTQNDELMQALKDQETFNPDALFGPIHPLQMGDLFKSGDERFRKRTSSANWAGTDGITLQEEIEYARKMGYTNQ